MLFIQESEQSVHDFLGGIIAEKPGEIDTVGNILDELEIVEGVYAAQNASIADDTALFHGKQRILQIARAHQIQRFGDALYLALQFAAVQHLFVGNGDQGQLGFPVGGGDNLAAQGFADQDDRIAQRAGGSADQ